MSSQAVMFTHSLRVNLFYLAIFIVILDGNVGMPDTESGAIIDKASRSQTVSVFYYYTNCNNLRNKMGELMMVPETYGSNLKMMCDRNNV